MLDNISHGEVVELRMNRPPANALNHALLEALLSACEESVAGGARGIILSGREGMFCAGIDVPELLGQDRASIHRFWSLLFGADRALANSTVPIVAAIAGHSPAGGAVLASHCDYRVAAEGNFKIGFNEVQVGLPLPPSIMHTFSDLVGTRTARRLGMEGRLIRMDEACDIGLVDELVPPDQVVARALEYLEALLRLPPIAMNRTRMTGKARLLEVLDDEADVESTTIDWFSDETQRAMRALVKSLKQD